MQLPLVLSSTITTDAAGHAMPLIVVNGNVPLPSHAHGGEGEGGGGAGARSGG